MSNPWRGLCYEAAYHAAAALEASGEVGVAVVHGAPVLRGPEATGERFGHAWVEYGPDRPVFGRTCHDPTAGEDGITLPALLFYALGHLEEERVRRYILTEARVHLLTEETWGPWEGPALEARHAGGTEIAPRRRNPRRRK